METSSVVKQYVTDKGIDFMVNVAAVVIAILLVRAFTKG